MSKGVRGTQSTHNFPMLRKNSTKSKGTGTFQIGAIIGRR